MGTCLFRGVFVMDELPADYNDGQELLRRILKEKDKYILCDTANEALSAALSFEKGGDVYYDRGKWLVVSFGCKPAVLEDGGWVFQLSAGVCK